MTEIPGNFVWSTLTGFHQEFAEMRGRAARYRPEYGSFAAVCDWDDGRAWHDLAEMVGHGSTVWLGGTGVHAPREWDVVRRVSTNRMVATEVKPPESAEVVQLGPADISDVLDLAARAQPGPFAEHTVQIGTYLGVRRDGLLVAMAGERFRTPGWTEISTVCTDPAYRRRGLAGLLVSSLTSRIQDRGDRAFLHVREDNPAAAGLYERLGFTRTVPVQFIDVRPPAQR